MASSSIEWTQLTWNPTTGCDKVSPGCKHCYAEVMSRRLQAMGLPKYRDGFQIRLHDSALAIPYAWKKPAFVFVNSMSDLFHDQIPLEFISKVFSVMADCSHLTFQVLTKRAERLAKAAPHLSWPANVWMGVSVENSDAMARVFELRKVPAAVRFLSCEPLLGPLGKLPLRGIDWIIVGGESGPRARPMHPSWVESICTQCQNAGVPFFFKQWGGRNKKQAGREFLGSTHDAMPQQSTVRLRRARAA